MKTIEQVQDKIKELEVISKQHIAAGLKGVEAGSTFSDAEEIMEHLRDVNKYAGTSAKNSVKQP